MHDNLRSTTKPGKEVRKSRNLSFSYEEWAALQDKAAQESARVGRPLGLSEFVRIALDLQPVAAAG